ncbi:MAG TPA: hypothetical protein VF522_21600 [Ramlibacter sp.]|uniref:hypothetical protein n=1 Tax=Ramlibacter sp. TaxID=1917967 RepID=UPI002ED67714
MKVASLKLAAACAAVALLVAACGGGGGGGTTAGGSGGGGGGGGGGSTVSSQLVGTAATGAALANAPVTITNSAGASPCTEAAISTDGLGKYTCTLKTGETAPFFIVVTDPSGNTGALVSVAVTTPAAGTPLTVNATPLTTAIVAQLAGDGNALTVVNNRTVDAAALQTVTANVVAQLAPVLTAIGMPAGYDPFATSITAATAANTGNTADLVLDIVKVVTDPASGQLALTTIDNPTPVILATASSAGSTVTTPNANVSSLSQAAQLVAQKFNACFALSATSRVLAKNTAIPQDQGGPEVQNVATACQDFVSDATNAGGIDFLHNGYNAGQLFYGLLTSDQMTGAAFSVPEIVAFYPANGSATPPALDAYDRAIVNIRYMDAAGNAGSVITVAARIPGSSSTSRPTDWWLVGNQQAVDITVRVNLRRVEQLNTGGPRFSTFQSGMVFNINSKGPGTVQGGQNLEMVRVTGPGLTTGGLVYKVSAGAQNSMDMWNKTGSLTVGSLCNNSGASVNCPNLWFSRTAGITGTQARTLASNPNNATNGLIWAQPADGFDPSAVVMGARYKFELFYGANTGTPDRVIFKTLLTNLIPATQGVDMPWNTPGPQTLAALDPAGSLAGAQSALPVDWVQNLAAPQIGGVTVTIDAVTNSFGPSKPVPRGATSAIYNVATVPAFTTTTSRTILFSLRSTDSTNKSAVYTYN